MFCDSIRAEVEKRATVDSVVRLLFNESMQEHKKLIDQAVGSGRAASLMALKIGSLYYTDYATLLDKKVLLKRHMHHLRRIRMTDIICGIRGMSLEALTLSIEKDAISLQEIEQKIQDCLPSI